MVHEQYDESVEPLWRDAAANPEVMAREREITEIAARLNRKWDEDSAGQMRVLQLENAATILQQCGVAHEDIRGDGTYKRSMPHVAYLGFRNAGRNHSLTLRGEQTQVTAWDERLGDEAGFFVSHAYHVCRSSGYHPDDVGLPPHLADYVRNTLRSVTPLQEGGSFNERYGFINFTLSSPRQSWAIPVAMGIAALPIEEAMRITDPAERGDYNGHLKNDDSQLAFWHDPRFITVPGPGTLVAESMAPTAWRLDTEGALQQGQPLDADPMSRALMQLLETMR